MASGGTMACTDISGNDFPFIPPIQYGLAATYRDQPFFFVFSDTLVHDPWQPTPDSPEYETFDETSVNDVKYFGDNVRYQDKLVGRLIDELDTLGIRERTLVFFTGDNGTHPQVTSMTNRGAVQGDKGGSLDAAMHVPLIASWPGTIAPGQVRDGQWGGLGPLISAAVGTQH